MTCPLLLLNQFKQDNAPKPRMFYHLKKIPVTQRNYTFVREIKKRLLGAVGTLLDALHVRYSISDGNLLEYERDAPIYHDDDVDIRVDSRDYHIISNYIGGPTKTDTDCNLFFNFVKKTNRWYHVSLINAPDLPIRFVSQITLDLVSSNEVYNGFWPKFDIDFDNLRRITYLDVETCAPSKEDSIRVLTRAFGIKYLKPNYPHYNLE